jgi:hypothetical protein
MDIHVVHDLLDKPVLDEERRNIGRVDGVVLQVRRGKPPRVTAFEIGGTVWLRRLHPRLARWAESLGRRLPALAYGVTRIPMREVRNMGITVGVRCDGRTLPAMGWEHWLRRNVIGRIPGA